MKKLTSRIIKFFKRKRNILVIVVVLGILFFIFRPKAPAKLDISEVKREVITESISVSGSIVAKKSVDLSFTTSGKLVFLGVTKGDHVAVGQTIAMQDTRTVQKNLENALISYSEQRNTFDQTKDNNQNRTSEQSLNDQMRRVLENNQNDLNKAVISVELQNLAKEQSILVSPISGIVTRADAKSAGVNVSSATIFTIVDPSTLVFNMDIDEADIGKITVGDIVKVTLDSFPEHTFASSINSLDFASHTTSTGGNAYTAEVGIENVPLDLRAGMNGTGEIILQERANALTIPISSIFETDKVYVKTKKGIEIKKVTIGIENDTDAEIVKGLLEHDTVLTQPSQAPKNAIGKK